MRPAFLELLRCPACRGPLLPEVQREEYGHWLEGELRCPRCGVAYPLIEGIPRFVPADNYAESFGLQWNQFRQTQLDSYTGTTISRDRFLRFTGWAPEALAGKKILDVGCGAGRFAEIALLCGAEVVALDYSSAVTACRANLGHNEKLLVAQADIYNLPFALAQFDFVYCLGVLQHTPDVARAFGALPPLLRSGGRLAVDLYPRLWLNWLWPKYWLRPVTKRIPKQTLFRLVKRLVPILLPISDALARLPVAGGRLRYAIPVMNYLNVFPLTEAQRREWAVLDTFDMLAPAFDQPQSAASLRGWFQQAGLIDVWVGRMGFLVGRGRRAAD